MEVPYGLKINKKQDPSRSLHLSVEKMQSRDLTELSVFGPLILFKNLGNVSNITIFNTVDYYLIIDI